MNKLLVIAFLSLLLSGNVYANDRYIKDFDDWLLNNNHNLRVKDLDIKFYKNRSNIPWDGKPNKDTLLYYAFRFLADAKAFNKVGSKGSKNPYEFQFNLREDKYVKKQMNKTALLSYLLYENGKITVDEITPYERFGIVFKDNTRWTSASVGKSLVSYLTGHAICEGYIDGIDSRLNDWPLLENTLFYDQKLIDILNMAAGDQKYSKFNFTKAPKAFGKDWSRNPNNNTIKFHMQSGIFKDSKKGKNKYNYSNVVPNVVINYVNFKSNGNFQKLLDKIFISKAKVKYSVYFLGMNSNTVQRGYQVQDTDGLIRYSFRASRYDYLRIAKAILDDWQNDTCVGKYLKNIHERRIPKNNKWKDDNSASLNPKNYAGFFHTNYSGISSKKRNVMGMVGYGGQSIMIDFDKGRINVINSIHIDYNWKKLVHSVIKKGK